MTTTAVRSGLLRKIGKSGAVSGAMACYRPASATKKACNFHPAREFAVP